MMIFIPRATARAPGRRDPVRPGPGPHSGAPAATIRLTEDAYAIRLEVTDEGKGFPDGILDGSSGTGAIAGVGIRGMLERMRLLGGRLEDDSGGGGMTVRAILPASSVRRDPARDDRS
jgi:signal transduction histidine kinase